MVAVPFDVVGVASQVREEEPTERSSGNAGVDHPTILLPHQRVPAHGLHIVSPMTAWARANPVPAVSTLLVSASSVNVNGPTAGIHTSLPTELQWSLYIRSVRKRSRSSENAPRLLGSPPPQLVQAEIQRLIRRFHDPHQA